MKRIILHIHTFCLLTLLCPAGLAAQSVIRGIVINRESQLPVEAATVQLTRGNVSLPINYTLSNNEGTFTLTQPKRTDSLLVSVSLLGYQTQQQAVHAGQTLRFEMEPQVFSKYSINSLVYWVTYVHNVVYSFYRSMIYCYINSTQRCAGSIVIDIIPTNGADKRKFFPFAPYFPVTNVIKRYFYPYFPAIIGIKGYSFPYFPYLSGIMKIKTALYSLFSRLDWHKTVVFPCLGEIYEGIRSLSWEIPVT